MANDYNNYPPNYLVQNEALSKQLSLVLQIEGVDTLFGIANTYTVVRYGDPNLVYGLPGLVYGGLRINEAARPWIVLDSSLTIQQRIEPEQGKANIATLTITLVDKDGLVSELIAPGIVAPELMMSKEVKVWLGFQQSSFPGDFLLAYRGYITQTICPPGIVKFQISDGTLKERQALFDIHTTFLLEAVDSSSTLLRVSSHTDFYQPILGPDGNYDPTVNTYVRVDDEIMEYDETGLVTPEEIQVTRGALGSTAVEHDIDATVTNAIRLGGGTGDNAITIALKLLLSGWNGPCEEDVSIQSFVYTYSDLGFISNTFLLKNIDAQKDLGLTIGDYFYVTDATNPANNLSGQIIAFGDAQYSNQIVYTDQVFTLENPTSAVCAFRSQFDTYPVGAGLKLRMRDVDVNSWIYIRDLYFTSNALMQFYFQEVEMGLDFIATKLLLPLRCYGVSRFGRISLSITKPPLPGQGKLVQLDWTNVLEPEKITVMRSANSRTFYNQIQIQYDKNPLTGNYQTIDYFLDTNSYESFQMKQTLPIEAPGIRSEFGGGNVSSNTGQALLGRYKDIALLIDLKVNWTAGSVIEVSDIVILKDDGNLKIMNFQTGKRNIGTQMFEVIDRKYNIMEGTVSLKLLGGLGFNVTSRFGLISPSTLIGSGSTSTVLSIIPSFGQTSIAAELLKWTPLFGNPIRVHSFDYATDAETVLIGLNATDPTKLDVSPALPFTPAVGDIIDIASYPTGTDPEENQALKALYAYITPTILILTVISETQFTVSVGDAANLTVGNLAIIRTFPYWERQSEEFTITDVTGTTVTISEPVEFIVSDPDTYVLEGIGFHDGLGYYRVD